MNHKNLPIVGNQNSLRPLNEYKLRKRTTHLVVHCSATPAAMDIGAEEIREWHVEDNHWLDIGYHFVIRRDGSVELGRPLHAIGAGVNGANASTVHVCLVGGVSKTMRPEDNFNDIQKDTLKVLLQNLLEEFPEADICGHRDFPNVKKACPSFDVRAWCEQVGI